MIYSVPGLSQADKGFAACTVANAYQQLHKSAKAPQWARTALGIKPDLASCRNLVQGLAP